MLTVIVTSLSLVCQLLAAGVAIRIANRFRPGWGWLLLALALILMAIRRAIVLTEWRFGLPQDFLAEVVGLLVSVAALGGVLLIKPVLERSYRFQTLLEMEAHRLNMLLQGLPGVVYQCRNDPQWTMEYISDGCYELTGYSPDDLIGNRRLAYAELIVPEDRDKVWNQIQESLQQRRPYRLVYRIRTAAGETKWVWEQGTGVFDEEGEVLYLAGYISDVTTWQKIREDLERTQALWKMERADWLRMEQRLLAEVWDVQERYNESIAFEIHDGFVQQATGALMSLETYRHLRNTVPQESESFLERAIHLIRNAIGDARRLIRGLRPALLEEGGLLPALEQFFQEMRARHGVDIEFSNETQFLRLAPPLEIHLFRIIQEAVWNAVRHSQSPRIAVSLRQLDSHLEVQVRDWGVGFDVDKVPQGHYGLHSIRDRAKLLGGWAEITSQRQQGTSIQVMVPLYPSQGGTFPLDSTQDGPLVPAPSSNG